MGINGASGQLKSILRGSPCPSYHRHGPKRHSSLDCGVEACDHVLRSSVVSVAIRALNPFPTKPTCGEDEVVRRNEVQQHGRGEQEGEGVWDSCGIRRVRPRRNERFEVGGGTQSVECNPMDLRSSMRLASVRWPAVNHEVEYAQGHARDVQWLRQRSGHQRTCCRTFAPSSNLHRPQVDEWGGNRGLSGRFAGGSEELEERSTTTSHDKR